MSPLAVVAVAVVVFGTHLLAMGSGMAAEDPTRGTSDRAAFYWTVGMATVSFFVVMVITGVSA